MHALLQIRLEFRLKFLSKSSSIAVKYLIDVFLSFICLSSFLQILDAFFLMVSASIQGHTSRIFIDFLLSQQFGRLISDHQRGFRGIDGYTF